MYTFKNKALREEHQVETTITDENDRQQTIVAKIEIRYEKLDFKCKTSFNSAAAGASDFVSAFKALVDEAARLGKEQLSAYKQRAGVGDQGEFDFGAGEGEAAGG